MSDLTEVARIDDPNFYISDPEPIYRRLRHEAPVFWYEPANFWVLSKYEDIRYVSSQCPRFTTMGGVNITVRGRAATAALMPPGADNIMFSDPPRHGQIKRIVSKAFTPHRVAQMETWMRDLARELVAKIEPGEPVDFAELVSVPLPLLVIGELIGVPPADRVELKRWADAFIEGATMAGDPEHLGPLMLTMQEAFVYFSEMLEQRKAEPAEDLMTALLHAELDGEHLSDFNLVMFCVSVMVGGNETTRNFLSGSIKALSEYPDQRARLVEDRSRLKEGTEELLRWVSPVVAMGRTANEDTEVRGTVIKEDDYVMMLYGSGNRDEDIWPDAEVFDVNRPILPNHVAFGFGEHLCLGTNLARLEGRVLLDELLERFPHFELAGEIEYLPSTFLKAIEHMPVVFSA